MNRAASWILHRLPLAITFAAIITLGQWLQLGRDLPWNHR